MEKVVRVVKKMCFALSVLMVFGSGYFCGRSWEPGVLMVSGLWLFVGVAGLVFVAKFGL